MKILPLHRNAIGFWRFSDRQPTMIATRLHPAYIITYDEDDVRFLVLRLTGISREHQRTYSDHRRPSCN